MKIFSVLEALFPIGLQLASVFVKNPVSQQIETILVGEAATIIQDLQAFHASRQPAPAAPASK